MRYQKVTISNGRSHGFLPIHVNMFQEVLLTNLTELTDSVVTNIIVHIQLVTVSEISSKMLNGA